jgi:signal transduction histidine kinase
MQAQQQQVDSLLNELTRADHAAKSNVYFRLSQLYSNTDINKSISYGGEALNYAASGQDQIKVYLHLGGLYLKIGNIPKAVEQYERSLALSSEINDGENQAKARVALGGAWFIAGNLAESLSNYLQALRFYEERNNSGNLVNIYNGLANIYAKQNNFSKALEYNLKAITIYEASSDRFRALIGYEQVGNMYLKQGNYSKAEEYFLRSLRVYIDLKNRAGAASARIQLGNVNFTAARYASAARYYLEALASSRQLKMLPLQATSYNGLAQVYEKEGRYDEAIMAAKQASEIARSSGLKIELDLAYETLSRLYSTTSKPDKAITFSSLSKNIKDSLYNDSTLKQLADLQLRYDSEKKQKQIEIQQKEQQVLASELLRERQLRNTFIAALVFVTLAFVVFIYLFTQNKRIAQNLVKQKKELEETTNEIIRQKEELGQLNNVKDRFFSIISHDLRNNLTTMKLYFDLVSNKDYTPGEDTKELTTQISSSVENTIDLLENLLVWAQAQIKGITVNPRIIDVYELAQDNINLLGGTAHHKGITLLNKTEPGLTLFADADMVNLVVRNLVSNAIKFTRPGGMVTLETGNKNGVVELSITDNGVGISAASLEKMFVKNQNPSTLGTGNEKGTGLGLLLCKEFVEKNNGRITVTSTEGAGSTFTISLPASAID